MKIHGKGEKGSKKPINIQWKESLIIIIVVSKFQNNNYCNKHLLEIMRQILNALPVMTQDIKLLVNKTSFNFVDTTFTKATSSETGVNANTAMLYNIRHEVCHSLWPIMWKDEEVVISLKCLV